MVKYISRLSAIFILGITSPSVHAEDGVTVTLTFSSPRGGVATGFCDADGNLINDKPWAIVIDIGQTGFSEMESLSQFDILSSGQNITPDTGSNLQYMISHNGELSMISDVNFGGVIYPSSISAISAVAYSQLMEGKSFGIIWFPEYNSVTGDVGSSYGFYTADSFVISGSGLRDYSTVFGPGPTKENVFYFAVPEPGTYAVIIAGFSLVGCVIRRRLGRKMSV